VHNPITCQSGKSPPHLGSKPQKLNLSGLHARVPPNNSQILDKQIYYAKNIETHGVLVIHRIQQLPRRLAVNIEYKGGRHVNVRILVSGKKVDQRFSNQSQLQKVTYWPQAVKNEKDIPQCTRVQYLNIVLCIPYKFNTDLRSPTWSD